jgi:hypothetical protein
MRREYDFSEAKRGAVVPVSKGKRRITIRLDDDIQTGFASRWKGPEAVTTKA